MLLTAGDLEILLLTSDPLMQDDPLQKGGGFLTKLVLLAQGLQQQMEDGILWQHLRDGMSWGWL